MSAASTSAAMKAIAKMFGKFALTVFLFWAAFYYLFHFGDSQAGSVANSRLAEWSPRRSFPNASDGLEVERVSYERNGFCKHRGANSESTFNDARLTVDIACEVEECRLTFA